MLVVIAWLVFSFLVAFFGGNRKIGFTGALILSLIFSPLIGLVFVLLSKDRQTDAYEKAVLKQMQKKESKVYTPDEIAQHADSLKKARKQRLISEREYQKLMKDIGA